MLPFLVVSALSIVQPNLAKAPAPSSTIPSPIDPCSSNQWKKTSKTGFVAAWQWCGDKKLVIALADDSAYSIGYARGVHVFYNGVDADEPSATYDADGDGDVDPVKVGHISVVPRTDGTSPTVSMLSSLQITVQGSDENGCAALGYDEVYIDVSAQKTTIGILNAIKLTFVVDGTIYYLVPPNGTATVTTTDGTTTSSSSIDLAALDAAHADEIFATDTGNAATFVSVTGSDWGSFSLRMADPTTTPSPLPWFQVAGDGGFVEFDMDHSCEAEKFSYPTTTLIRRVVTGIGVPTGVIP